MSFDTYREFEASLKSARERRRKPNVNKNVLKKLIISTEAHNRNQEEQEMWMKHFASKNEKQESPSPLEHRKRKKLSKKKKSKSQKLYDDEKLSDDSFVGPDIDNFLESKKPKWGHDGFHELYGDAEDPSSSNEKHEKDAKKSTHRRIQAEHDRRSKEHASEKYRKFKRSRLDTDPDQDSSRESLSDDDCEIVKKSRKKKKKKHKKEKLKWVEK